MTRYLIFRHGQALGSGPDVDRALTDEGKSQAEALGKRLSHFHPQFFVCSPLLRARQTAEIVSSYIGLKPEIDSRLTEVGSYRMFYEMATGEGFRQRNTLGDFNRTQLKLLDFLRDWNKKGEGQSVLISAHGNIIQALLAITIGVTDIDALTRLIVANTGLTVLEWLGEDNYQLVVFNDTQHLGELIYR